MHSQILLNPWDQLLNLKYKKARNELTSTMKNTELKYYSDEFELNISDLYKKWGVLRNILGKDDKIACQW